MLILGAVMERRCSATLSGLEHDLREAYKFEEQETDSRVPQDVPGDIRHDPDVPPNVPGDMEESASSG